MKKRAGGKASGDGVSRMPFVAAPQTDLGSLIVRTLEDRWAVLSRLLEAVQKKATKKKVHELRIATRRMASIVEMSSEIVGGKAARRLGKRLSALLSTLGELRDVQVQRKEIGRMAETFEALSDFHDRLRKLERELEPKTEKRLQKIDVGELRQLFETLAGDVLVAMSSESLLERHRTAVVQAVDRRFARLIDRRRALDVADLDTMHRMRVAFKKFRYMVEVLQPILVGMGRAQLESMQAFQTMMGDVHDLDVLNQMVAQYRAQHKKQSNDLVAAQDDIGRRLLSKTDGLVAAADEIYSFWNQSYLPG